MFSSSSGSTNRSQNRTNKKPTKARFENALEGAVNLMPFGKRAIIENIIRNIIYLGLPKRIEFLDGDEKAISKEKEN